MACQIPAECLHDIFELLKSKYLKRDKISLHSCENSIGLLYICMPCKKACTVQLAILITYERDFDSKTHFNTKTPSLDYASYIKSSYNL